jgi:hypothetical protein
MQAVQEMMAALEQLGQRDKDAALHDDPADSVAAAHRAKVCVRACVSVPRTCVDGGWTGSSAVMCCRLMLPWGGARTDGEEGSVDCLSTLVRTFFRAILDWRCHPLVPCRAVPCRAVPCHIVPWCGVSWQQATMAAALGAECMLSARRLVGVASAAAKAQGDTAARAAAAWDTCRSWIGERLDAGLLTLGRDGVYMSHGSSC